LVEFFIKKEKTEVVFIIIFGGFQKKAQLKKIEVENSM